MLLLTEAYISSQISILTEYLQAQECTSTADSTTMLLPWVS